MATTSIGITFRYDRSKVRNDSRSSLLLRYDGSGWVRVGAARAANTTETRLLSTDAPQLPLNDNLSRVGWYAIVTSPGGTLVSVR